MSLGYCNEFCFREIKPVFGIGVESAGAVDEIVPTQRWSATSALAIGRPRCKYILGQAPFESEGWATRRNRCKRISSSHGRSRWISSALSTLSRILHIVVLQSSLGCRIHPTIDRFICRCVAARRSRSLAPTGTIVVQIKSLAAPLPRTNAASILKICSGW